MEFMSVITQCLTEGYLCHCKNYRNCSDNGNRL